MADEAGVSLASLAIEVDSTPVPEGVRRLHELADAGGQAETAAKRLTAAERELAAETRQLTSSIAASGSAHDGATQALVKEARAAEQAANAYAQFYDAAQANFATQYVRQMGAVHDAHGRTAKSSKHLQLATLDLSRQFADVGVSLASNMPIWMVAIQQGPQIADRLALMKMEGIGLTAALKGMAGAAGPAVLALAPLIAVAGAAAAGFALMHRELAKGYPDDVTIGLGLTEEQLDRVKHKTVTMGDTFTATVDVMGKYLLQGPLGEALDWLDVRWNAALDGITDAAFNSTAAVVGAFIGSYRTIEANWRNFPAVMGDVFVMAANTAIDAVERMVNASIKGLNALFAVLRHLPQYSWLPSLPEADLSRFKGQVSGAAEFTSKVFAANVEQAQSDVRAGMRRIGSEIATGALEAARTRALKEAGKSKDGPDGRTKKEAAEVDELAEAWKRLNEQFGKRNDLDQSWAEAKRDRIDPVGDMALIDADVATNYADTLAALADQTRVAARNMASAFGSVGAAIGGVADAMASYEASQAGVAARLAQEHASYLKVLESEGATKTDITRAEIRWQHELATAARDAANARIGAYGDMAAAGRSFFEEGSKGYELLAAAEKAFRLVELGFALQAIAMKGAEATATVTTEATKTGATLAGSAVRTTAKAAEGIAGIFAALGPFAFPVAAAATAVMVAAGVKMAGGGGGAPPGATHMEDRQRLQGTGSILGDSKGKSDSIAKSLELVAANTNRDLEYSNSMLKSLRGIESGIGAVAAGLARSLSAGGSLSTDGLGLGTSSRSGSAMATALGGVVGFALSKIMPGWFGSTTTRTLQDQGLQFGSQSLSDILSGGIDGETYSQVLENTKKKFLGVTYSDKNKVQTTTGSLDADLANQITGLIGSLKAGVLEAAAVLGVTGAEATLDAFQVELGKLSFKDMSGAEIQEALSAIFGKLGDDLAATAIPELTQLQKVGEGAFETLARVAGQYQVVDTSLTSIGMQFGAVGVSSLKARERLVDLVGGIDELAEQAGYFAENFLSDLERMAPVQRAVANELERLGLANVKTKDDFKNIVLGLDLTTEAGAKLYASLMDLAPAFAKVIDFQAEGSKDVQTWRDAVVDAYEREAGALENTRDKLLDLAKGLRDFSQSLDPLLDTTTGQTLDRTYAAMMELSARADTADTDAIAGLQSSIQDYLDAAKADAGSSLEYQIAVATAQGVAKSAERAAMNQATIAEQQLAVMKASVEAELGTQKAVYSLAEAMAGYQGAIAAQAAAAVAPPVTTTPTPTTPAANDNPAPVERGPDWASYMAHYTDVAAEYARNMASEKGRAYLASLGATSSEAFGELHWSTNGKREGRTPYAAGGLMDRPITLGEMGLGGEAGPEGILPLANVGGKLGVRSTGGNDSAQLARLHAEMVRMNAALISIARSTHELNRNFRRAMAEGLYVRGPEPDAPVQTKAAA